LVNQGELTKKMEKSEDDKNLLEGRYGVFGRKREERAQEREKIWYPSVLQVQIKRLPCRYKTEPRVNRRREQGRRMNANPGGMPRGKTNGNVARGTDAEARGGDGGGCAQRQERDFKQIFSNSGLPGQGKPQKEKSHLRDRGNRP